MHLHLNTPDEVAVEHEAVFSLMRTPPHGDEYPGGNVIELAVPAPAEGDPNEIARRLLLHWRERGYDHRKLELLAWRTTMKGREFAGRQWGAYQDVPNGAHLVGTEPGHLLACLSALTSAGWDVVHEDTRYPARHERAPWVLVCGGRDVRDHEGVYAELDRFIGPRGILSRPGVVIHGAARGADETAGVWASRRGYAVLEVPACWEHGRAAGPTRNRLMCELRPDLVLAFPGGRGTEGMIKLAQKAEIEVIRLWEHK